MPDLSSVQKTLRVLFKEPLWQIVEPNGIVSSYKNRAMAARRAVQKAEAAAKRGDKVLLLLHNMSGNLESTRAFPTVRKPRAPRPALALPST